MTKIKILLILFLIIGSISLQAQTEWQCSSIIVISGEKTTKMVLYDNPNGKIIRNLFHDSIDNEYYLFMVKSCNDSMFYGFLRDKNSFLDEGWIYKNKDIIIYTMRNRMPLTIYKFPDFKSDVEITVTDDLVNYTVLECKGSWLKVCNIWKGKYIQGWIPVGDQCHEPESGCLAPEGSY